jgi:hypothetical protein
MTHKDSEEIEDSSFPIFGNKPQELGSSISYARRYNIQALLNLAAEDDNGDAANASSNKIFKTTKERTALYNTILGELEEANNLDDLQVVWVSRTNDLAKIKASELELFLQLEDKKNQQKDILKIKEQLMVLFGQVCPLFSWRTIVSLVIREIQPCIGKNNIRRTGIKIAHTIPIVAILNIYGFRLG